MGDKFFVIAFEALRANKVRALLTMLGIIIGVMAVIVMIGLGQASQSYITQQVQGMGSGVLILTPGNPKNQSFGPPGMSVQTLTLEDADAIEHLPGIRFVSANAVIQTMLKLRNKQVPGTIVGAGAAILGTRDIKVGQGRFYTEQEARQGSKVIVLGQKLVNELYTDPTVEPFQDKVKIDEQRYRVIGILAEQGGGLFGSVDEQAFMPTRTFQQNLRAGKRVNSVMIKVVSEEYLAPVSQQIAELLRQRHHIRPDEDDDFKLQSQAELLATVGTITQVFTFLLAGIASISLLVGGIGIMNIMLVSVTERTREIGVRKAVGAKRRDILMQFLIESATLSLAGGTIGMLLGMGLTYAATRAAKLPFVLSTGAIVGAFAFSAGVGIFFGLYPANKAAKLDPVEALRYE